MRHWSASQIGKRHYRVTLSDAIEAHRQALDYGGGRAGISNLDNLAGALGRPYHGYHRAMAQKAAALLHGVASSHGFVDGNKRSAWLVTFVLIGRSGFVLRLSDSDRIDDVVVDVVEGAMSEAALVEWFKARLVRG